MAVAAEILKKEFTAQGVKIVEIRNESGGITVEAVETGKVTTEISDFDPEKADLTTETHGDAVLLEVKKKKSWWSFFGGESVKANFKVTAPKNVFVKTALGNGTLEITGMEGGADIKSGNGEIKFTKTAGDLTLKTGNSRIKGDISSKNVDIKAGNTDMELSGLLGSFYCKSGNAGLKLEWNKVPEMGEVNVKAGNINAQLTFPHETKLSTSFTMAGGNIENEFQNDPSAAFKISMTAGSGRVTLKKSLH